MEDLLIVSEQKENVIKLYNIQIMRRKEKRGYKSIRVYIASFFL